MSAEYLLLEWFLSMLIAQDSASVVSLLCFLKWGFFFCLVLSCVKVLMFKSVLLCGEDASYN